jgi:hypothetical protein
MIPPKPCSDGFDISDGGKPLLMKMAHITNHLRTRRLTVSIPDNLALKSTVKLAKQNHFALKIVSCVLKKNDFASEYFPKEMQ